MEGFRVQWNLGQPNEWGGFKCQIHLYAGTDVRRRRNASAAQGNSGIQDKVTGDEHLRMQTSFLAHDGCSKDFKWDK